MKMNRWLIFLFLLGAMLVAVAAQAQIYKWTDSQGRVHFSDHPPEQGHAETVKIHIPSFGGPAVVSRISSNPGSSAGHCSVTIYTTQSCPYCMQAKAFLSSKGIGYRERDVGSDDGARQEFARLNGRGVPVILVGDQRMDGFDQGRLTNLLKTAGC